MMQEILRHSASNSRSSHDLCGLHLAVVQKIHRTPEGPLWTVAQGHTGPPSVPSGLWHRDTQDLIQLTVHLSNSW